MKQRALWLVWVAVVSSLLCVNAGAEEATGAPVADAASETVQAAESAAAQAPEAVATTVTSAAATTVESAVTTTTSAVQASVEGTASAIGAVPEAASMPAEPKAEEMEVSENLEFVSGEVTALDEAAKTVTVKLYGDTENEPQEKSITVKVDETTDITDGEKDRDYKSLAVGTEVDVEYDPASNKATYLFVY